MRSVFTIDLPCQSDGDYSCNADVLALVRSFGWEPVEIKKLGDDEAKKEIAYKELADELFKDMPEIAVEEKGNVIFYGYLADDQSKFVITRRVEGQITFRLLHPILPRLQSSTEKMVRKVINAKIKSNPIKISGNTVLLYERGQNHVILTGRVISSPYLETFKNDKKDILLTIAPLFIFILMLSLLSYAKISNTFFDGTLERASTAMLTTVIVSALGLLQTFLEIRSNKLVAWKFTEDQRV